MDDENHDVASDGEGDSLLGRMHVKRPFKAVRHRFVVVTLILLLVMCVAAIIGLAIGVGIEMEKVTAQQSVVTNSIPAIQIVPPATCVSPSCVRLAGQILASLDMTVDPCEDFYNFTCGNWMKQHTIPQGNVRYGALDTLMDANEIALQKILEGSEDGGVEAVSKLKALYRSCMDITSINKLGSAPLLQLILDVGGWSLLDGTKSTFDINGVPFMKQKMKASPALFSLAVVVDDKNSSLYSLELDQSGLSLPTPGSYNNTDRVAALKLLMTQVLGLINSTLNASQAIEDVASFESTLASVFIPDDSMTPNSTYNIMTVEQLQNSWPYCCYPWPGTSARVESQRHKTLRPEYFKLLYNWSASLNWAFNSVNKSIDSNQTVIVTTPGYFNNLTNILSGASNSTLENYALWQLVYQYLPYLDQRFLTAYTDYSAVVGLSVQPQRYTTCIGVAQTIMPMALARPYADYVLPTGTKGNVSEMASSIIAAFKTQVSTFDWLDEQTKSLCLAKADAIDRMVAYPNYIYNDTYLSVLYNWLNTSGSYFASYDQFVSFGVASNLKVLNTPVDKTVWDNAPTAVNAYYDPNFNQFVFLEGIMNVPVFDVGWPKYFQYGAMGVVIGHELTHGFDNTGQQYNAEGILTPWWSPGSQANFTRKAQCFVDQYSRYQVFGMNIKGATTLGENIADNGGVKISYQAYSQLEPQLTLPALPYTPNQLFFISFGQVWCSLLTPSGIETSLQSDPHSPGPYRVIGSLQNSVEFAAAFNCPSTSYMNPPNKCVLW